jgi:sodium transport system ATP-binding protein
MRKAAAAHFQQYHRRVVGLVTHSSSWPTDARLLAMISAAELTKRFEHAGGEVLAVDRLSFRVGQGEVYGLLGANGAGKTTTLRMILGLLEPTSGYAEVDGYRTSDSSDAVKQRIGFVSTSAGLYQWLTPRELLLFFADLYNVLPQKAEVNVNQLAALFGFAELLDRRSATLSTGQKQRVNLARSLVHDPPVILLDEPTRGLDVLGSKVIFDYIAAARQAGKAVMVCTHRLDEAERLCDRFGLLHRGRMLHEGTLAELQASTGLATLTDMFLSGMPEDERQEPAAA